MHRQDQPRAMLSHKQQRSITKHKRNCAARNKRCKHKKQTETTMRQQQEATKGRHSWDITVNWNTPRVQNLKNRENSLLSTTCAQNFSFCFSINEIFAATVARTLCEISRFRMQGCTYIYMYMTVYTCSM